MKKKQNTLKSRLLFKKYTNFWTNTSRIVRIKNARIEGIVFKQVKLYREISVPLRTEYCFKGSLFCRLPLAATSIFYIVTSNCSKLYKAFPKTVP